MANRRVRVLALATAGTVLAATAHALGSGRTPTELISATPGVALASAGALSVTSVMVLGRQRRPWWVVALVLSVVQAAQHLAFLTGGSSHGPVMIRSHAGHSPTGVGSGPSAGLSSPAPLSEHGDHGPGMLVGHLLAATLTGLLVAHGEHTVHRLATWLAWPLLLFRAGLPLGASRRPAPPVCGLRRLRSLPRHLGPVVRGPPPLPALP